MKLHRLVIALLALLLAACGTPAAQTSPAPSTSSNPSVEANVGATPSAAPSTIVTESTPSTSAAFPVAFEHKYGNTTIPQAPTRVVSLGYTDQDPILALGVVPVAVRYFFGDEANAVWSWAQDKLGDATPKILNMPFGELNFETITALQPDLIIGVSAGITQAEYDTLSAIAPTVAQSAQYVDFGVPWQEQTQVIGQALGKDAQARALVAQLEARFAQVRAEHPEFVGATAAIAAPAADGQFFVSGPQHERQRVLTSLGFVLPTELEQLAGDAFYGTLSAERLDLLNTDVLIWTASPQERTTIDSNPVYQQLDVARQDRAIFLDTSGTAGSPDLAGPALVFSSVLNLPTVFDELVPQLAPAVHSSAPAQATTTAESAAEAAPAASTSWEPTP